MKSKHFEEYAKNQMILNLSLLAVVAATAAAVALLLTTAPV